MDKKDIFTSQKKESTVDFVINNFKKLLLTKQLLPGDSIPNENDLADSLNVSRGSIREAMKILSAFGIVEIRRGDGTYIAESVSKSLFEPFLFSLIMSDADTRELVELREVIEHQVIRLIIKNSEPVDIEELEKTFHRMKAYVDASGRVKDEEMLEYDLQFHRALGKATRNVLVEKIYNFILELFTPYIESTYGYEENGSNAVMLHKEILDSLKARDIDSAIKATQISIEEWRSRLSLD
jgi:GntR family transcriptional regulator, transcriptional repressor for pyruvate dehydrogenase complex